MSDSVRSLYGLQPLKQSNSVHGEPTCIYSKTFQTIPDPCSIKDRSTETSEPTGVHPKTIQTLPNPCSINNRETLVLTSTCFLNEVTVNNMDRLEHFFRLTAFLLPFEQFFTDNESSIELLIQRIYSLPTPYSTQRSVNVDSYIASLLHPAILEALTPVCTTGDSNCLWNAISNCLCGSEKYTYTLCLLTAYGLIKFKERMIAQLWAQNPDDSASNNNRCSELLRIAITPTAWGSDFHCFEYSHFHVYILCM